MSLATRRMDEMTSREIEQYFQAGGNTVFIPFGPVSGHGAFIPMGIHGHWATAVSVLLAEKVNALVYPTIFTCFSGATRTFRGAVSFTIGEQVAILKKIALILRKQGFLRTILVGGTSPESYGGNVAARELFDETEQAFLFIDCSIALEHPDVRAIWKGYPGNFGETVIGLASLKILGRQRPIPVPNWAAEIKPPDNEGDQPADIHPDVAALRSAGMVGWRYYEERNHGNHGTAGIQFKGKSDIDLAVEALEKSAEVLMPVLASLDRYNEWLSKRPVKYITPTERLDEK